MARAKRVRRCSASFAERSRPPRGGPLRSLLAHTRQCEPRIGVTETRLCRLHIDAFENHRSRVGSPQIVEREVRHSGAHDSRAPHPSGPVFVSQRPVATVDKQPCFPVRRSESSAVEVRGENAAQHRRHCQRAIASERFRWPDHNGAVLTSSDLLTDVHGAPQEVEMASRAVRRTRPTEGQG